MAARTKRSSVANPLHPPMRSRGLATDSKKNPKGAGRKFAWYTWTCAYVAREVRRRRPEVTTHDACEAAIHSVNQDPVHESRLAAPPSVRVMSVKKALQKLERGGSGPREAAVLIDRAVDDAMLYLKISQYL